MRYRLFLLNLIIIPLVVHSQNNDCKKMLQIGKEWNYDMAHYEGYGNNMTRRHSDIKFWIEKDTTISGKQYFIMRTSTDGITSNYESIWHEEGYKVFKYNKNTQKSEIEYDFGMELGQDASSWGQGAFSVTRVDTVLAFQIPRKRIMFQNSYGETTFWIEGVGNPGSLEEPLCHTVSDGVDYTLLSCYENGECIFEINDFCLPPYFSDNMPDKQWHYINYCIDNYGKGYPDKNSQQSLWGFGKKSWNGKEYDMIHYNKGISPFKEDSIMMRNEQNRIYIPLEDYCRVFSPNGVEDVTRFYPCENNEVILYDFNIEKDGVFGNTTVRDVSYMDVEGSSRKVITFANNHKIVEAIGSLTGGFFDYLKRNVWENDYNGWNCCYLDTYHEEGLCVFMQLGIQIYNDFILNNCDNNSIIMLRKDKLYDLQGRQLRHAPAKGVYIQDGKKRVVK